MWTTTSRSGWRSTRKSTGVKSLGRPSEIKIEKLELMDELTTDSKLTDEDVDEIAAKINESARKRIEEESG